MPKSDGLSSMRGGRLEMTWPDDPIRELIIVLLAVIIIGKSLSSGQLSCGDTERFLDSTSTTSGRGAWEENI